MAEHSYSAYAGAEPYFALVRKAMDSHAAWTALTAS
jgi:hypothetical protein